MKSANRGGLFRLQIQKLSHAASVLVRHAQIKHGACGECPQSVVHHCQCGRHI